MTADRGTRKPLVSSATTAGGSPRPGAAVGRVSPTGSITSTAVDRSAHTWSPQAATVASTATASDVVAGRSTSGSASNDQASAPNMPSILA